MKMIQGAKSYILLFVLTRFGANEAIQGRSEQARG